MSFEGDWDVEGVRVPNVRDIEMDSVEDAEVLKEVVLESNDVHDWLGVVVTLNDLEHVRSDDLDGVVVIVGATDDDTVSVRWHFAPPYSSLQ